MTFEEWWEHWQDSLPNDVTAHNRDEITKDAWEAGYAQAEEDNDPLGEMARPFEE